MPASGGVPNAGGSSGSGGTVAPNAGSGAVTAGTNGANTGGAAGTSPNSGGAAPSAGSSAGGTPNAAGGGGISTAGSAPVAGSGGASVGCNMSVTQSLSEIITTVAAVEWTSDLAGVDSASIEYGLDTNYGMVAPVDLAEPNHRTLLLGMRTGQTYHFRVVANSAGATCTSADQTVTTGARPSGIAIPNITTTAKEKLYGGYLLTARWGQNNGGPAFILDADGELVWWFYVEDDAIRTRLSFDGKKVWIRNTGQIDGQGIVRRMSLDGSNEQRWELTHTTHDLAVLPDGRVGLIGHASGGCDEILLFDPETEILTPIFNAQEAHGRSSCHVNFLAYSAEDDTLTFSDYEDSSFTKISLSGEIKWILNGSSSTVSGTSWSRQHGIHFIAQDHILVFSNGSPGQNSLVFEYRLDLTNMSATELWNYDADLQTTNGGDLQRLENGNTMIAYSSSGVVQELGSDHSVLQEIEWPLGNTVSYIEKRKTLYGGPPPRIYPLETTP